MIVLDTNVLSEVLRPSPAESVMRWLAGQPRDIVATTAVTQAEVLYGVEALPAGKRRKQLHEAIGKLFSEEFRGRVFPFDEESAGWFAKIVVGREAMGRPISQFDAMIAAIARCRQAAVATRNVNDFQHCGVSVIDPWAE